MRPLSGWQVAYLLRRRNDATTISISILQHSAHLGTQGFRGLEHVYSAMQPGAVSWGETIIGHGTSPESISHARSHLFTNDERLKSPQH